jgi:hypothetical protein
MTIHKATEADIALILRLLADTPNPPNEEEETIQAILDDPMEFVYIDPMVPVLCRMAPRRAEQDVPIPWWVWVGAFRPGRHLPILGVTARAVKEAIPVAGPWPVYGNFPGAGDTKAERSADSKRQADEHASWLGGVTSVVSPRNPSMQEARSTIDAVIAAIPERPR